jgi:hypothetical protein
MLNVSHGRLRTGSPAVETPDADRSQIDRVLASIEPGHIRESAAVLAGLADDALLRQRVVAALGRNPEASGGLARALVDASITPREAFDVWQAIVAAAGRVDEQSRGEVLADVARTLGEARSDSYVVWSETPTKRSGLNWRRLRLIWNAIGCRACCRSWPGRSSTRASA